MREKSPVDKSLEERSRKAGGPLRRQLHKSRYSGMDGRDEQKWTK